MENTPQKIFDSSDYASAKEQQTALQRVLKQMKSNSPLQVKLNKVISLVGEMLTADRCYIFKCHEKDNVWYMSQLVEWVRHRVESQLDNPELYDAEMDIIQESMPFLEAGEVFVCDTVDINDPAFREVMESQDIDSFIFAPIIVQKDFWGFLGVDSCRIERTWKQEDGITLINFATIIGNHLELNRVADLVSRKDQLLQVAIESSNDGFWYLNIQENKLYFSKQWKSMLGFEEDEIENSFDQLERLIHPEDRELVLSIMDPYTRSSSKTFDYEYRMLHKTEGYIWVMTQAYVKFDDNGIPKTLVGTNIDISARVSYQQDLQEQEEEYSEIINAVHDVIFTIDEAGLFGFLNPAWNEITGFSVSDSLGTAAVDYVYPHDRESFQKALKNQSSANTTNTVNFEIRLLKAGGAYCWVKFSFTLYFDRKGIFSKAQGTITDIHQRKMAEIAQKESEEKFRLMSENMSDVTCLHKTDGTYSYASPSIYDMLGFEPEEMMGKMTYDFVHPEDRQQVYESTHLPLLKGVANKGVSTLRLRRADGSYIWVETITQAIKKGARIESILSVTRDISERIEVEMEMKKALEKEKELNELKSRFVSMASHEFRTPLTSIKSSIQLLEMYAEELKNDVKPMFDKHFSKMVVQIDRLSDLMNNILVLGRTEADKIPFEPEEVDLKIEIEKIIRMDYAPWQDGRTLSVQVKGEERPVFVDINLMGHIVNNMLSNAFKYSKGKPSPEIVLQYDADCYEIQVKDYGIGIPQEEQDQLFSSFFRADNTINIEGTGLGLVILKQFVELHHGTVEVKSKEGEGTLVTVKMPYQLAEAS